ILKTNIKANLINPGATRTRMRAEAYPGEKPETVKAPEVVAKAVLELCTSACDKHGELITVS
ncbi:MAG: oxidoreductase, partial [Rhodospirillales bacterium]|nr:oxidoreductase [Rhodospirillales bacterium]